MSDFRIELLRADIKTDNHIMIRGYFADDDPQIENIKVYVNGRQVQSVFHKNNLNEIRRDYSMHGKDVYEEYYASVDVGCVIDDVKHIVVKSADEIVCDYSGKHLQKMLSKSHWQLDAAEIKDGVTYIYGRVPHAYNVEIKVGGIENYRVQYMADNRIAALFKELEDGANSYFVVEIDSVDDKAKYEVIIKETYSNGKIRKEQSFVADIYSLTTPVLYGQKFGMIQRLKNYSRRYGVWATVCHYATRLAVHAMPVYTYDNFSEKYRLWAGQSEEACSKDKSVHSDYVVFTYDKMTLTANAYDEFNMAFVNGADIVYADEDGIVAYSSSIEPRFKTGYSLEYLYNVNYIGFPVAVKKSLLEKCGVQLNEIVTADMLENWYDALLTLCENANEVCHIEKVLAHSKVLYEHNYSNKDIASKHLKLRGIEATVEEGIVTGTNHVKYNVHGEPLVSIVIPNKDNADVLKRCVDSIISKSTYRNFEIIIVENNSTCNETFEYYKTIDGKNNIKVLYYPDGFNFSAINNFGIREAKGEYLLILNNDTELLEENSIKEMLGVCQQADVGIVGALLYFPDDTIQHAGVAIGLQGLANHLFSGMRDVKETYLSQASFAHDVSAVTAACLMISKNLYNELDGFDERLTVAFNDVDLCLRVREKGLKIIYTPYAQFYHYESKSRGQEDSIKKQRREEGEVQLCGSKHEKYLADLDPFYNRNHTRIYMDGSFRR